MDIVFNLPVDNFTPQGLGKKGADEIILLMDQWQFSKREWVIRRGGNHNADVFYFNNATGLYERKFPIHSRSGSHIPPGAVVVITVRQNADLIFERKRFAKWLHIAAKASLSEFSAFHTLQK